MEQRLLVGRDIEEHRRIEEVRHRAVVGALVALHVDSVFCVLELYRLLVFGPDLLPHREVSLGAGAGERKGENLYLEHAEGRCDAHVGPAPARHVWVVLDGGPRGKDVPVELAGLRDKILRESLERLLHAVPQLHDGAGGIMLGNIRTEDLVHVARRRRLQLRTLAHGVGDADHLPLFVVPGVDHEGSQNDVAHEVHLPPVGAVLEAPVEGAACREVLERLLVDLAGEELVQQVVQPAALGLLGIGPLHRLVLGIEDPDGVLDRMPVRVAHDRFHGEPYRALPLGIDL